MWAARVALAAAALSLLPFAASAAPAAAISTSPGARSGEQATAPDMPAGGGQQQVRVIVTRPGQDRVRIRYLAGPVQLTQILIDTRTGRLLGSSSRHDSIRVFAFTEGDSRLRIRYR